MSRPGLRRQAGVFSFVFVKTETECLIRLFNGLLGDPSDTIGNDRGRFFRTFDKDNVSFKKAINFDVYDLNGDGYISREEMFHMLKNSLIRQPTEEDPDEGIKDLVVITLKKMDHEHDSRLSYADFEKAVRSIA
uniref:Calaxin n=1 Tax=Hucho hucho TaxID=62062 RepID=A0A4W5R3V9_9TELE